MGRRKGARIFPFLFPFVKMSKAVPESASGMIIPPAALPAGARAPVSWGLYPSGLSHRSGHLRPSRELADGGKTDRRQASPGRLAVLAALQEVRAARGRLIPRTDRRGSAAILLPRRHFLPVDGHGALCPLLAWLPRREGTCYLLRGAFSFSFLLWAERSTTGSSTRTNSATST
jgi:hypothetical protein